MNTKIMLEKLIAYNIERGWQPPWAGEFKSIAPSVITGEVFAYWQYKDLPPFGYSVLGLIHYHEWAKSLWGEVGADKGQLKNYPAYLYHLQESVIQPTPEAAIKYQYESIFGKEE